VFKIGSEKMAMTGNNLTVFELGVITRG